MRTILASSIAVALLCVPVIADAQAIQRPVRPFRGLFGGGPPPDPNRNRHELNVTASLLGGYDDMLTPTGQTTGPIDQSQSLGGGYTGTGDVTVDYFLGRADKSLAVNGRGYTSAYSFVSELPAGGSLEIRANTPFGRNRITASQRFNYSPNLVLGTFAALQGDVDPTTLPDSGERSGLSGQRSVAGTSYVNVERGLATRHTVGLNYVYDFHRYLDDIGYDVASHSGMGRYMWAFGRYSNIHAQYAASISRYAERSRAEPQSSHVIEFGGSHRKPFSPTRQLVLSAGGGATYMRPTSTPDAPQAPYWIPSGQASMELQVARTWALSAQYRRSATVLQGITLESFASHAATLGASGFISNRIETALTASYSNGRSGTADAPGRYVNYGGMAQFRYALTRWCAASATYDYSYYQLRGIPNLPQGFLTQYDRNGIRVGLTVWLPLYGSYGDRRVPRQLPGEAQ